MTSPNLDFEEELWNQGRRFVAGVDEVGRGAWAGPVVAAAVVFPEDSEFPPGVKDSKLLTPKKREELCHQISEVALAVSVGETSVSVIENKGIAIASEMAMEKALANLGLAVDYVLTDYFPLKGIGSSKQKNLKKGDVRCASIAAASIVAKVYRDSLMRRLDGHKGLDVYQFGRHKGYGTRLHQEAIVKFGVCRIHRVSFVPTRLIPNVK